MNTHSHQQPLPLPSVGRHAGGALAFSMTRVAEDTFSPGAAYTGRAMPPGIGYGVMRP